MRALSNCVWNINADFDYGCRNKNLDFVLFEPTEASLRHLLPRVIHGGVIALDEYAVGDKGESEAVDILLRGQDITLQSFPWAKSPTAYFIKKD